MPWTAEHLIEAYRLTTTLGLTERALDSGVERVTRWFGEPAYGGEVRWTWHRNRLGSPFYLGLPEQCANLKSVTVGGGQPASEVYLANRGWTIRRDWLWLAPTYLDITATGIVVDDTARRDSLVASLALEELGYSMEEQGRSWRTQLLDMSRPEANGRLPDVRVVTAPGMPTPEGLPPSEPVYVGTVPDATATISLAGLEPQSAATFQLPTWTGNRYIVIARAAELPIEEIQIAGLDQTPAFRQAVLLIPTGRYIVWTAALPWAGEVASGTAVRVSP